MLEKLQTKVFMGTGIYCLCGKPRNILMDKMDERFKQLKTKHEWITGKGFTSPPVQTEIAQRGMFLKADG